MFHLPDKPWTSPPASSSKGFVARPGAGSLNINKLENCQMTSSTPCHFEGYSALMAFGTPSNSAITPRYSLELFQGNSSRHVVKTPFRPSLTTDFALSALKNSFSMSSLSQQCQFGGEAPDEPQLWSAQRYTPLQFTPVARLKWERPCNSLTRVKERGVRSIPFRRSLGSSPLAIKQNAADQSTDSASALQQSGSDGAGWPALQANYTYLMNCDLIESCRSINGEISINHGVPESSRQINATMETVNSPPVPVDCPTNDGESISIPELSQQLLILRNWLKRMESKVPKLTLRPTWTRAELKRRIIENKVLRRQVKSRSSEFGAIFRQYASLNPRQGHWLENRYHRLLLQLLEWSFHLEELAKKPPDFWNSLKATANSTEEVVELPRKIARRSRDTTVLVVPSDRTHNNSQQSIKDEWQQEEKSGFSPPLPAPTPFPRASKGVTWNCKHPESTEESQTSNSEEEQEDEMDSSHVMQNSDKEVSNKEWTFSPINTTNNNLMGDESLTDVRKRLSFESLDGEEKDENLQDSKSWLQISDSESDCILNYELELEAMSDKTTDEPSDMELISFPPECATADLPGVSASIEPDEIEEVRRLIEEAKKKILANEESDKEMLDVNHNMMFDEHSLISEGEKDREANIKLSNPGDAESATLNRTFVLPDGDSSSPLSSSDASPVLKSRRKMKSQSPASSSSCVMPSPLGIQVAGARWAVSDSSLNRPPHDNVEGEQIKLSTSLNGLGSTGERKHRLAHLRPPVPFHDVKTLNQRASEGTPIAIVGPLVVDPSSSAKTVASSPAVFPSYSSRLRLSHNTSAEVFRFPEMEVPNTSDALSAASSRDFPLLGLGESQLSQPAVIVRVRDASVQTDPEPLDGRDIDTLQMQSAASSSSDAVSSSKRQYFRRIFKASLVFYLIAIVVVLFASVLGPSGCSNVNFFSFSFLPKLNDFEGPVPV